MGSCYARSGNHVLLSKTSNITSYILSVEREDYHETTSDNTLDDGKILVLSSRVDYKFL